MSTTAHRKPAHCASAVSLPVRLWPPRLLRPRSIAHGHLRSLGRSKPLQAACTQFNACNAANVTSASSDGRSDAESLLGSSSDQLGGTVQRWTAVVQRLPHLLPLLLLAAVACTNGELAAALPGLSDVLLSQPFAGQSTLAAARRHCRAAVIRLTNHEAYMARYYVISSNASGISGPAACAAPVSCSQSHPCAPGTPGKCAGRLALRQRCCHRQRRSRHHRGLQAPHQGAMQSSLHAGWRAGSAFSFGSLPTGLPAVHVPRLWLQDCYLLMYEPKTPTHGFKPECLLAVVVFHRRNCGVE